MQATIFRSYKADHGKEAFVLVLGTSAIALTYNIVHSLVIQQTSAVTTTVIGQAKIIGLLMLSAILLGEHWDFPEASALKSLELKIPSISSLLFKGVKKSITYKLI